MMKRLFSLLLVVAMLVSTVAFADLEMNFTSTEEELTEMLPVLEALTRSMGVEGEQAYDREDPMFVWTTLWHACMTINNADDEAANDVLIYVPEKVMLERAAVCFSGMTELPAIPANEGTVGIADMVRYSEDTQSYAVVNSDLTANYGTYPVVDCYAEIGDGEILATVSLYSEADDSYIGSLTVTLVPNGLIVGAQGEFGLPLAVENAAAATDEDYEGYTPVTCHIVYGGEAEEDEYEEEEEEVEEEVEEEPEAGYDTLQQGDRGDAVQKLQQRLTDLGYECGSVDGIYGSRVSRAVRYFQDSIGYNQSGKADVRTQEKLYASDAPAYERYKQLKEGMTGIRVEYLQDRLIELGYMPGPMDGAYGARTTAGVKLFQKQVGLSADGIAGKKTLKSLYASGAEACESYIDLKKGDTGCRVTELQKALRNLGYMSKKASGTYDNATVEAVVSYMIATGYTGNNGKSIPAKLVAAICGGTPAPTKKPEPTDTPIGQYISDDQLFDVFISINTVRTRHGMSSFTSKSKAVSALQKVMGIKQTGVYDQNTYENVEWYNRHYGFGNDGIATVDMIESLMGVFPTPTPKPTKDPGSQYITDDELFDVFINFNCAMRNFGYEDVSSKSKAVSILQAGVGVSRTGVYDQKTYEAIRRYNINHGIGDTGLAQIDTVEWMIREYQGVDY